MTPRRFGFCGGFSPKLYLSEERFQLKVEFVTAKRTNQRGSCGALGGIKATQAREALLMISTATADSVGRNEFRERREHHWHVSHFHRSFTIRKLLDLVCSSEGTRRENESKEKIMDQLKLTFSFRLTK